MSLPADLGFAGSSSPRLLPAQGSWAGFIGKCLVPVVPQLFDGPERKIQEMKLGTIGRGSLPTNQLLQNLVLTLASENLAFIS